MIQGSWIDVRDGLPSSDRFVPLALRAADGRNYWVRACYARPGTMELSDDCAPFAGCIEDEQGTVFVPEGWYECNENDEVVHRLNDWPTAWYDIKFPDNERVPDTVQCADGTGTA